MGLRRLGSDPKVIFFITEAYAKFIYITISTITSGVRHKNFFSLKSPWDHPRPPGLTPGGARARFTAGKLLLEGAREAGTF